MFYIDGYYLTEVPVTNGVATWNEMIGSQTSNFQVVYVPSQGSSPRWVSDAVSYTTGQEAATTSSAGTFPTKASQDPTPASATAEIRDGSADVTVKAVHHEAVGDSKLATFSVLPEDDRMTMRVKGGIYAKPDDEYPACGIDFVSAPGTVNFAERGLLRGREVDLEAQRHSAPGGLSFGTHGHDSEHGEHRRICAIWRDKALGRFETAGTAAAAGRADGS